MWGSSAASFSELLSAPTPPVPPLSAALSTPRTAPPAADASRPAKRVRGAPASCPALSLSSLSSASPPPAWASPSFDWALQPPLSWTPPAWPGPAWAAGGCVGSSETKSHTRRCRAKVNENIARLQRELPPSPRGTALKHKAQILEYAVRLFRDLMARRALLTREIALASPAAVGEWAAGLAAGHAADALAQFAALYAAKHSWAAAEVWLPGVARARFVHAAAGAPKVAVSADVRAFARAPVTCAGLVGRTFAARTPLWLDDLGRDASAFARSTEAKQTGLNVGLAVPVLTESGTCDAVLLFLGAEHRDYSMIEVNELMQFAGIVAKVQASRVVRTSRDHEPNRPLITT